MDDEPSDRVDRLARRILELQGVELAHGALLRKIFKALRHRGHLSAADVSQIGESVLSTFETRQPDDVISEAGRKEIERIFRPNQPPAGPSP